LCGCDEVATPQQNLGGGSSRISRKARGGGIGYEERGLYAEDQDHGEEVFRGGEFLGVAVGAMSAAQAQEVVTIDEAEDLAEDTGGSYHARALLSGGEARSDPHHTLDGGHFSRSRFSCSLSRRSSASDRHLHLRQMNGSWTRVCACGAS